jgi:bifunctional ADP-heptose synthase (sugar kinase/adenylyltransferase)
MKKLLAIIVLGLLFSGNANAKIDWEKRNLCEVSKYKSLCAEILDKKLFGLNTIANFKFEKGKIIALINLKKGENMSLLADPDPSYVAKYTGEYLVYKNADGVFITEFVASSPMKHLICDNSNKCINANSIRS